MEEFRELSPEKIEDFSLAPVKFEASTIVDEMEDAYAAAAPYADLDLESDRIIVDGYLKQKAFAESIVEVIENGGSALDIEMLLDAEDKSIQAQFKKVIEHVNIYDHMIDGSPYLVDDLPPAILALQRTATARNSRLHQLKEAFYENTSEELAHTETYWDLQDFLTRPDVDPATRIKVNNASKIDSAIKTVVERTAVDENGRPIPEISTKLILRATLEG